MKKRKPLLGMTLTMLMLSCFGISGRGHVREKPALCCADTIEAAATAIRPSTEHEIEKLVNRLVDDHVKDGQLNNSELTMGDLREIRESFIETLKGRYHLRVKYPGNNEITDEAEESPTKTATETGQNGITGVSQPIPIPLVPQTEPEVITNRDNGIAPEVAEDPAAEPVQSASEDEEQ